MQGNILSGLPAILPSQVMLPSGKVIAVSAVAFVRILYECNMTICSKSSGNITCLG